MVEFNLNKVLFRVIASIKAGVNGGATVPQRSNHERGGSRCLIEASYRLRTFRLLGLAIKPSVAYL